MRKLGIVSVPLLVLALTIGAIGCVEEEIPTPTFTPVLTLAPTPTPMPTVAPTVKLTPTPIPTSVPPTATPAPTPTFASTDYIINDLAYVKAFAMPYTDDADPEYEGIKIYVSFYDTKSERIYFTREGVVWVDIELYTAKLNTQTWEHEPVRCVYQGSGNLGKYHSVKIPFESIAVNPGIDDKYGTGTVLVHTPKQGDYTCDLSTVHLYESH